MERRFRVWRITDSNGDNCDPHNYRVGEVYKLMRDDRSMCPKFEAKDAPHACYIYMHDLEEIDEQGSIIRRFDVGSTYTNPIDLPIPEVSTQERIARIEKELAELKKSLEPKEVKFTPGKVYKSTNGRIVVCISDDDETDFSGALVCTSGMVWEEEGIHNWAKCCFHPVEIQVIDSTEQI